VPPERDLTLRAAQLLRAECGVGEGVTIGLEKHLPMGGGLGGGSSDAATTLVALNHLWRLGLTRDRLIELGLRLGADVPFFVYGRSAFVEGIGERLQPLPLPPACYLVIEPGVSVPTAAVFAAPELTRSTEVIRMADFSGAWAAGRLHNDLQPVVCARSPEVAAAIDWLDRRGEARMTGSGACVFAAFAGRQDAADVLARLPAGWRGWIARGLDEHPLTGSD
jgi:4-diphosphocytidyl-2-C-methyl-D-erythritol kinase